MTEIKISQIVFNPDQPRKQFNQKKLEELAQSIKEAGLIQAIRVQALAGGTYLLIAGERRVRAHQLLGFEVIDANIIAVEDAGSSDEHFVQAFIENVQREDMNAMEVSNGYQALLESLGSVEAVCQRVGKSDAHVYSYLNVQDFDDDLKIYFERGVISVDPKVIAALKRLDPERRLDVAAKAATFGATSKTIIAMCTSRSKIMPQARKPIYVEAVIKPEPGQHFDALVMVKANFSENLKNGARATCQSCELYDMASPTTCRVCPLVSFLRNVQ